MVRTVCSPCSPIKFFSFFFFLFCFFIQNPTTHKAYSRKVKGTWIIYVALTGEVDVYRVQFTKLSLIQLTCYLYHCTSNYRWILSTLCQLDVFIAFWRQKIIPQRRKNSQRKFLPLCNENVFPWPWKKVFIEAKGKRRKFCNWFRFAFFLIKSLNCE